MGPPQQEQICFKFIIVGNSAVGKSCLLLRFDEDRFQPIHDVTVGVTFSIKFYKLMAEKLKFKYGTQLARKFFVQSLGVTTEIGACAIIVFDITDTTSFDKIDDWIQDIRSMSPANCHIVIVGNKIDLADQRTVETEKARSFAENEGIPYYETSALSGEGVEKLLMIVYMMFTIIPLEFAPSITL